MERDPLKTLERLKPRPLSQAEQSRAWAGISARRAAAASIPSPFSSVSRRALVFATAFILIFTTVGASDRARPGEALFVLDRAVERAETIIDPASRAEHAEERVEEFERGLAALQGSGGAGERVMQKEAADSAMLMVATGVSEEPPARSRELELLIETTRGELSKLAAQAALQGDTETLAAIAAATEAFEARVRELLNGTTRSGAKGPASGGSDEMLISPRRGRGGSSLHRR
jgi:hypothetical protein